VSRIGDIAARHGFDVVIALLAVAGMLELILGRDSADAPRTTLWFTVPAIGLLVLPLLARRRFPFAAATAFWLLAAILSFVDGRLFAFAESLFLLGVAVAFVLGNLRDPVQARIGLAVVVTCAAVVVYNLPGHSTSELLFTTLVFGVSWVAGFALRERAEQAEEAKLRAAQAEREREAAARIAVAEERVRIARELHDVVAHAVSVMVLQIGAVRHKLSAETLEQDKEALTHVEQAGRTALAEMRRLLGAMRRDGDGVELGPQPGLDGLESLLEDVRRAGLLVRLHVEGEPFPLPRAIDLSAFRIVQEGLTNALRHARASHADVSLGYRPDELELQVLDNGTGTTTTNGLGHGLVGIRERVKIYGGEMSAGTAPEGGFMLTARLPIAHQP
jgi:signal transduction histidine kinase